MANWFSFTYRPYPGKDFKTGELVEIMRPTVPIVISYKGNVGWEFQALVDSGSDRNLLPAELGEDVGIDIMSGKLRRIQGIGKGNFVNAYAHKIKIFISNYSFDSEADFCYEQQAPLLGRDGFFNHRFDKLNYNIVRTTGKVVHRNPIGINSYHLSEPVAGGCVVYLS